MTEWKQKRFWKEVAVAQSDEGFAVQLDGRGVKTPAKAKLIVPTQALAQSIAQEWDAQEDVVNPTVMPFTRSANAAIDKVRIQHAEVANMLAAYGDSDLLCYRAEMPEELVARQVQQWDPYLAWAAETLEAPLMARAGVMHAPQDAESLAKLSARTHAFSDFELAAFHDLVSLTGSLILGFAATLEHGTMDDLWNVSRLDELWQEEQWGPDDEAQALAETKKQAFFHAGSFFRASSLR